MKSLRFQITCLWIITIGFPILIEGMKSACDNTPYRLSQRIIKLEQKPNLVIPDVMQSCIKGGKTK